MKGGNLHYLRRAGWAAVLVNAIGQVLFGIYGTCNDVFPSALRAELWAVERILSLTLPPLTICIDNQGVLDGIAKGRAWCCSANRPAADLWRTIWNRLDDIGMEGLTFIKVKGHATQGDVQAGRATELDRVGNDHADHFAVMGADTAEEAAPTQGLRDAHRQALRWYKWLLVLAGDWPEDVQKVSEEDKKKRKAAAAEAKEVKKRRFALKQTETWRDFPRNPVRPHTLEASDGLLVCTACRKQASLHSDSRSQRDLCKGICLGNVLKRCSATPSSGSGGVERGALRPRVDEKSDESTLHVHAIGGGHVLWQTGELFFCWRCACHGERRAKGLLLPCSPDAGKMRSKATILARLKSGCHPRTKEFLGKPVRAVASKKDP